MHVSGYFATGYSTLDIATTCIYLIALVVIFENYESFKELERRRQQSEEELEQDRQRLEALVDERTAALTLAKEAAEAANRAKSTFLAKMSHELRTPINGMMGMTDLALRRSTDPIQKDQLAKARRSSQHLLAVIDDILDISKIEADRLTLEQTEFSLDGVLDNVTTLLEGKAAEHGLAFVIDIHPRLAHLPLLGDPFRLAQVLLNLTGNAIKFTPRGSITVDVRLAEGNLADVLVRFEVRDTGIGIAPENQPRLFAAFEQADDSTARKYGGSGLGLTISRRLVKLMGGEIGVESQLAAGSCFWFTARFAKAPGSESPVPTGAGSTAANQLKARHAGARILLVEDEPTSQEVSRVLLEDVSLAVDLAEDGVVAVAMAQRTAYDLILMDMQMPRLNGMDATRAIRALPGYGQTPILAMTANAFAEDRRVSVEAGMNDHIAKPVDPVHLFETLLKWLQQPGHSDAG